jgi:hypothetical protein
VSKRARLPAFHCGSRRGDCSSPRLSVRPCFLGRGRSVRSGTAAPTEERRSCAVTRALPAPDKQRPVPVQRCTSRAGHSAGRMMPKPPGSQGDEPRPAGTALAPPAGVTGWRPLAMSEGRASSRRATGVKHGRCTCDATVDTTALSAPRLAFAATQVSRKAVKLATNHCLATAAARA